MFSFKKQKIIACFVNKYVSKKYKPRKSAQNEMFCQLKVSMRQPRTWQYARFIRLCESGLSTSSFSLIVFRVRAMRSGSSTANAGNPTTVRRAASVSLNVTKLKCTILSLWDRQYYLKRDHWKTRLQIMTISISQNWKEHEGSRQMKSCIWMLTKMPYLTSLGKGRFFGINGIQTFSNIWTENCHLRISHKKASQSLKIVPKIPVTWYSMIINTWLCKPWDTHFHSLSNLFNIKH